MKYSPRKRQVTGGANASPTTFSNGNLVALRQRVRVARGQPRHLEPDVAQPPLEHREIQLGQLAVVARLEPETHAIVAEAAAGRAEKVGCRRQPLLERRRHRLGA